MSTSIPDFMFIILYVLFGAVILGFFGVTILFVSTIFWKPTPVTTVNLPGGAVEMHKRMKAREKREREKMRAALEGVGKMNIKEAGSAE